MNSTRKNSIIIICVLILSIATRVYASETDTFTGNIGAWLRQSIWISLATGFENSLMKTDNETVFYNLNEETNYDLVSQPSAGSLTLYCKTSGAIQNFSITDIGTSEELIWYGRNPGSSTYSRKYFYVTVMQGASLTSEGTQIKNITLRFGGHQNFTVIKSGGYYKIYTGSYGNNEGTSSAASYYYYRPKGMNVISVEASSIKNANTYYDLVSSGLDTGEIIYASGVNEKETVMVTIVSGKAIVWNLDSTDITQSTKVREFSISTGGVANQGACVSGDYLYIIGRCYCINNDNKLLQHTNRR